MSYAQLPLWQHEKQLGKCKQPSEVQQILDDIRVEANSLRNRIRGLADRKRMTKESATELTQACSQLVHLNKLDSKATIRLEILTLKGP